MSKSTPFVLPAGLEIDLSGDTLSIGYEGDVTLEQTLGKMLGDVYAGGDLIVKLEPVTGALRAAGKIVVDGRIDAQSLHGREVVLGKQEVRCRSISADERIVIGAAKLQVDVIIAPEIVLDPKASGRVTIVESKNDPGPTKIRGGFTVAEYDEAIGDARAYLEERGLLELLESARRIVGETTEEEEADEPAPPPPPRPAPVRVAKTVSIPEPQPVVEESTDDPESIGAAELEPVAVVAVAAPPPEEVNDELHPKLMDAVKRIAACYEGKETPPAVSQLRVLVEARDYNRLRADITEVWNGLLGFHQKKGIRPHHQVTHAFNVIHGLVQQI